MTIALENAVENAMENQALVRSHKGPGIASFVIGLLSVWAVIALIGVASVVQIKTGKVAELPEEFEVVAGLGVLGVVFVMLIGIGLGIFGAVDRASTKAFPIFGLIVNVAMVALFIAVLVFNPPGH
jgi:hypothetical protein